MRRETDPEAGPDAAPILTTAQEMAEALAGAAGGTLEVVLLYGSHLLGASPDRNSALDFVAVVSDYRAFYTALRGAGEIHRPVWMITALARVLPPNVIAFTPGEGAGGIAKILVIDRAHLAAALGARPRDHFVLGRLVQQVAVIWAADPERARDMEASLEAACGAVLSWIGPYLREPFDAEGVGRRILEVCYQGEYRPEARDRSHAVFEAQREHFRVRLEPVLRRAAEVGLLVPSDGGYRFSSAVSPSERRRWDRHFRRSKLRATGRWLKHVLTFDNWLPYVHRKAERRLGITIALTPLERRWPLLFLWPRVVKLLLTRPDREGPP